MNAWMAIAVRSIPTKNSGAFNVLYNSLNGLGGLADMTTTFKRAASGKDGMGERRRGKVVYQPPEKAWTGVFIEETPHGLKIYKNRDSARHFLVIPWSKVAQIMTED